ncbi:sulfite exporter TauE/SafE family protein [Pseudoduganella ginsengisoli]|uniref:Probable membrane transporter protein n=1 Tax=Pseudoduganella ginsengisoli TaxID=1462440 RepID=A0A6L6PXB2_9BURK|nr:sulfite exporter TauE/SafE family protein [Pseudoduganella ginsengisoli]MTW01784.1 TSUP family transporter [Pseudoduganella ginsengisoli]
MDNIIYITLVFVLAGAVKGVTGMGLPTVAVALLSLVMRPVEAAALLVVPSLLTNVWQLLSGAPVLPLLGRLWPMMAGICAGTLLAGAAALDAPWAVGALGIALVVYALLGLKAVRWHVKPGLETVLSPLAGAVTGALSAATGVFVVPAVPYLQSLELDKDELVQAMGLSFTVSTLALAVALAARDAWQPAMAGMSFLAQLPALLGMLIGQRLRNRMQPALFRRCFLLALLVLGMHLSLQWAWH